MDGGRLICTGSPEQRAEDIKRIADAGTTSMIINVVAIVFSAMLVRMEEFATRVLPLL